MTNTLQFDTQNILQHGQSVHDHYLKIIEALDAKDYSKYQFPQILKDSWHKVKKRLFHSDVLKQYHIYHDCGKPYCINVDVAGRRHFKDHALVSYDVYCQVFSNDIVAKFIRSDMIFHSGTMEDITAFIAENDKRFLLSLWVTALAEIYSNSAFFEDRTGFNKKYAKLESILPKIL